jgi:hypothetical protein
MCDRTGGREQGKHSRVLPRHFHELSEVSLCTDQRKLTTPGLNDKSGELAIGSERFAASFVGQHAFAATIIASV